MGVSPASVPPAGSLVASARERLGNPWAALPFFFVGVVLPAALLAGASAAAVYGWSHAASQFGMALAGMGGMVVAGGVLLVALGIFVANPRRLLRTITVTNDARLLPAPRGWRRVAVAEVAGVGLGRQTRARRSRSGTWGLMLWRTDGSHAWIAGVGLQTGAPDPGGTTVARVTRQLHARILAAQGAQGPLEVTARQRHPALGRFSAVSDVWDPTTGRAILGDVE